MFSGIYHIIFSRFSTLKEVKIRALLMPHLVGTGDADHRPGEFAVFTVFIGVFCSIEDHADAAIALSVIAPLEPGSSSPDIEPQIDGHILHRDTGVEEFHLLPVLHLQDRQGALSERFAVVFAQVDIIHIVVIQNQSGAVLMHLRPKFHLRRDARVNAGQLARKNTHFIKRSTRLLPAQAQPARPRRHIGKALRHLARRIVEISQRSAVEIVKVRRLRHFTRRQAALRRLRLRKISSVRHAQPAVVRPHHFLDRRLASERAAQLRHKRPRRQMYQIDLAGRQLHVASMTGFLQNGVGIVILWLQMVGIMTLVGITRHTGNDRILRVSLIWSPDVFRTSHCHAVIIPGTSLRAHQIIPSVLLCEMRSLDAATVRASPPDALRVPDDLLLFWRILHHADRARLLIARTRLPVQGNNIFPSVVIMQDRSVKARRVQIHRLAPRSADILRRDQKIINVKVARIHGIHYAVHHIKQILRLAIG